MNYKDLEYYDNYLEHNFGEPYSYIATQSKEQSYHYNLKGKVKCNCCNKIWGIEGSRDGKYSGPTWSWNTCYLLTNN